MLKNQCLTFLIKESTCLIMKICNLLEARVKTKRNNCIQEFNLSQWLKPYI